MEWCSYSIVVSVNIPEKDSSLKVKLQDVLCAFLSISFLPSSAMIEIYFSYMYMYMENRNLWIFADLIRFHHAQEKLYWEHLLPSLQNAV